jgi:small subunit ribosomal protein S16
MKKLGRKHRPFFRICVIDRRKSRDGLPIEEVGTYDPMVAVKADRVKLNLERIEYWIGKGAQPSDRVATLLKKVRLNRFGAAAPAPEKVEPKALAESAQEAGATEPADEAAES